MRISKSLYVLVCLNIIWPLWAINHWVVSHKGLIEAKIDSPFFMREPQNLASFLDQIKHHENVERTYMNLLRGKEQMIQELIHFEKLCFEIHKHDPCTIEDLDNLQPQLTRKYLNRFMGTAKYELLVKPELPFCESFLKFRIGVSCFDHLYSMWNSRNLKIGPETRLSDDELGIDSEYFLSDIISGLKKNPNSWKHHTLGSYYWRMNGNAHQAIECARRGILLAPRTLKDIPLLSLGTILINAGQKNDADIVLSAAVDHAPHIAENHLLFGLNLALVEHYNRSMKHLELAKKLDSNLINTVKVLQQYIECQNKLYRSLRQIERYADLLKKEVNRLRILKQEITASHEKILQQQVPLGARFLDIDKTIGPFTNRGQYCSTRTLAGNDEPVLFCDFYSEMQMRLESKEVDIEAIEREMNANSEMLRKQLSTQLQSQMIMQRLKSKETRD